MQKPQKKFETPYNVDAEVQVIGCIMVDGMEAMRKISHILTPDDFYEDRNKWIFKAVVDIYKNGVEPDLITISDHMKNSGYLDLVGGYAGLSELTNDLVSVARVVHYAKIVSKYAVARRLLQAAREIGELTQDVSDVSELVEKAEAKLKGVTREARDADEKLEVVDLQPYMTLAREHREPEGTIKGLSTGLQKIDKMTQGFVPGELMIISGQTSHGKMVDKMTPILHEDGFRPIGQIKVGERVYSQNGSLTTVVGVYDQGVLPLYRITFDDGSWVDAGDPHLWSVITHRNKYWSSNSHGGVNPRYGQYEVMDTATIRKRLAGKARNGHVYIPLCEPIDFPKVFLPLDPYTVGAILGDGHIQKNGFVQFTTDDPELARMIGATPRPTTRKQSYFVKGVTGIMRGLELAGKRSWEKEIPKLYLYSGIQQRKDLLAGLLDTDGSTSGSQIEFSTTSKVLGEQVMFLAHSLGGKARIATRTTTYTYLDVKKQGRVSYRVRITLPFNPFRLERKKYTPPSRGWHRRVVSAEYIGDVDSVCIAVDHPSHLFVIKDCIVTHNTQLSNNIMLNAALNNHKVMFITMEMTKQETADRFNMLTQDEDIGEGKIFLNMRSDLAYTDVTKLIERAKERACDLVVIDHLHYFSRSIENSTQEVSKIVKEFKGAAIKYELPIILICHVRKMEPKKHPTIDDLRDSSLIAQDADIVLIVWRDQRPDTTTPNEVEVVLWKNRNRQKKHRRDFLYAEGLKLVEEDKRPAEDKERQRIAANTARITGDKEMADVDLGGFGETDIDLPEEWK